MQTKHATDIHRVCFHQTRRRQKRQMLLNISFIREEFARLLIFVLIADIEKL
jgi:hypothetical protein